VIRNLSANGKTTATNPVRSAGSIKTLISTNVSIINKSGKPILTVGRGYEDRNQIKINCKMYLPYISIRKTNLLQGLREKMSGYVGCPFT